MDGPLGSEHFAETWAGERSENFRADPSGGAAAMLSVYSYDRFLAVLRREVSTDDYAREVAEHVDAQLPQG